MCALDQKAWAFLPTTGQSATVSPNARYVMFVGPRPSAPGCGDSSCIRFALFLGTVSNHNVRRFALDTGPAGWTPDAKKVIFVSQDGLHVWPLSAGAKAVIAPGDAVPAGDAPPAWQPA